MGWGVGSLSMNLEEEQEGAVELKHHWVERNWLKNTEGKGLRSRLARVPLEGRPGAVSGRDSLGEVGVFWAYRQHLLS